MEWDGTIIVTVAPIGTRATTTAGADPTAVGADMATVVDVMAEACPAPTGAARAAREAAAGVVAQAAEDVDRASPGDLAAATTVTVGADRERSEVS